jgi:hypothetical protein
MAKLVARLLATAAFFARIQREFFKHFMEARNRFQGNDSASLCSLAGRYDNPIPTRFLAPIDCSKIPAQTSLKTLKMGDISKEVAKTLLTCMLDYTFLYLYCTSWYFYLLLTC